MTLDGPTLNAREAIGARDCVALLTAIVNTDLEAAAEVLRCADEPGEMVSCLTRLLTVEVGRLGRVERARLQHRMRHVAEGVTQRLAEEGHR